MATSDYTSVKSSTNVTFVIDCVDSDLSTISWNSIKDNNTYYIRRTVRRNTIWIHRVILERMIGRELLVSERVDHIDGNGLNNKRDNLRLATHMQNMANQRIRSNNTTGYKGVTKTKNKYRSRIGYNGKDIHIGIYDTPELAAIAYNNAACIYFGEFAQLNDIKETGK